MEIGNKVCHRERLDQRGVIVEKQEMQSALWLRVKWRKKTGWYVKQNLLVVT